jgi:hypothetical protein
VKVSRTVLKTRRRVTPAAECNFHWLTFRGSGQRSFDVIKLSLNCWFVC